MGRAYKDVLDSTRARMRQAQAGYTQAQFKADRVRKPIVWLLDMRFSRQLREQRALLERGQVVWGATVQANSGLFNRHGIMPSLPAAIIYSHDEVFDNDPGRLVEYANGLYDLKGRRCTRAMQMFADRLADEMAADVKLPVPLDFTDGARCYYSTLLIARNHLPGRHLGDAFFPIVGHPTLLLAVTVLPHWYWDEEFRTFWGR